MAERIRKREAPAFEEKDSNLFVALQEDGFFNTALNDSNQYGPHTMIILLGIFATITGAALLALMFIY
jgi:hypothetical protein